MLNTRSARQAEELSSCLRQHGFGVREFPCLEFCALQNSDVEIPSSASGEVWFLFTSPMGVEFMAELCTLSEYRIASIGEKTAVAVESLGGSNSFVSSESNSEAFAQEFADFMSDRLPEVTLLLPRGQSASEALPSILAARGAKVKKIPLYRTVFPGELSERLIELQSYFQDIAVVSCTSSEIVKNFSAVLSLDEQLLAHARSLPFAVIGQKTAETAKKLGYSRIFVAKDTSVESLVSLIESRVWSSS